MIRTPLLCATVFVGLAACAVAQRRPAAPARSDTGPTAPPSAPKDSLTRFLESFSYRNLGPAAYSGRVTALAVPSPRAGSYPNTFYVGAAGGGVWKRSEEHTSELQSPCNLVCRLLLEKKKKKTITTSVL